MMEWLGSKGRHGWTKTDTFRFRGKHWGIQGTNKKIMVPTNLVHIVVGPGKGTWDRKHRILKRKIDFLEKKQKSKWPHLSNWKIVVPIFLDCFREIKESGKKPDSVSLGLTEQSAIGGNCSVCGVASQPTRTKRSLGVGPIVNPQITKRRNNGMFRPLVKAEW